MLKKILNIGVIESNGELLNRKIRVSNLIALITLVTMLGFLPLAISLKLALSLYLLAFMSAASVGNIVLHAYHRHHTALYIYTACGFIYMFAATLVFGLVSNLHFFMLVICMVASVVFDNKILIRIFATLSITAFFFLRWYMKGKNGFINLPPEMKQMEENIGNIILLLLFIITMIIILFFKNENLNFQKAILIQKDIIEEKNKDITSSITYAKRIQESLLPTDKYIEKTIRRLKGEKD